MNEVRSVSGGSIPHWLAVVVLLVLVGLAVLRSAIGTQLDSFTVDEPWHVVAGATYARSGDFSLNPEHPPLAKLWVGAAMPSDFKLRPKQPLSEKMQERTWVEQTMFHDNDAQRAQARARVAMWTLNGLLMFALGLLLWRAAGWPWAVGTLAFLAIEPTMAAHLPVVMTDLPLALTLMLAVGSCGVLLAGWQWRWVLPSGIAIGLALGAKHSALAGLCGLALVMLVAVAFGWRDRRWRGVLARAGKLGVVAVLAVATLWAQYGLHFHAGPDGTDAFNRPMPDKVAELKLEHWRDGIAFADRWQLLPRAYLWGLADTVRTGVEARGLALSFIWGRQYEGKAPWFAWPAIVLSKLPLALLALSLLGALLLWRAQVPASTRWMLWLLLGVCGCHLLALAGSGGVWGGVRHATPLLAAAAVLAGAASAFAWQWRPRLAGGAIALLLVAAVAMTIREPRLWEYHNELVGGTANAYRYFDNEGLELGQRFGEIRAFHDREIASSGLPLYSDYWMGEEQTRAAGMRYRRRVESLDDTNVSGRYEGWFIYSMSDTLPWPRWDWDPQEVFKDMKLVARFGFVGIWKGSQVRPQTRASSLAGKVMEYIYKDNGSDWALVARRLEEVVEWLPQRIDSGIELGNTYLKLGDRTRAVAAYRRVLDQDRVPVDALLRKQIETQIAQIGTGVDLADVAPLKNPWLE